MVKSTSSTYNFLILLLAGDIETCSGPTSTVKINCSCCRKIIRKNQSSGVFKNCSSRVHLKCMTSRLQSTGEKLYCDLCYSNLNFDQDIEIGGNTALSTLSLEILFGK